MALPISSANAQALADSVAKHILDLQALIGSTSGLTAGQATTLGKIVALADDAQIFALQGAFKQAVSAESAWLTSIQSYNALLDLFWQACAALDLATGGLLAFLDANTLQVAPQFFDAFNRAAAKGLAYPSTALRKDQAFGNAVGNMGQVNVTGPTAGTFVAGTAITNYGNAPLSIFNAKGSAHGGSNTAVQVTYSKYNTSGTLLTGQTASATMPSGSADGTTVTLAVSGVAVTNITVTSGGTSGDKIGVKSTLLRSVAY